MPRRYPFRLLPLVVALAVPLGCGSSRIAERPFDALPPADHVPGATWRRLDPAAAGWDADRLERARRLWADNSGTSAVMVVQRGAVVAAWGDVTERNTTRSIRKSLLSSLIGMAVAEGQLRLDATLAELGIDDRTPLTAEEKRATLADLLASRSGVYIPAARENAGHRRRRPARGSHPAGTFFYYNNWDFNVLGAVYAREVEPGIGGEFARRVASPLAMEDFRPQDFELRPEEISPIPAYDFAMSARDLARYGLLWARRGRWGDRQLIDPGWVERSTRPVTPDTFAGSAYGWLWWVQPPGTSETVPEGCFYAEGGSHLWVLPARDLVIVHHNRSNLMLLRRKLGLLPDEERIWEVFRALIAAAPAGTARSAGEVVPAERPEVGGAAVAPGEPHAPARL